MVIKFKKVLNRGKVLELLQSGKTIAEISEMYNLSKNAIRAHVFRLIKEGKWQGKYHTSNVTAKTEPVEVKIDEVVDRILYRAEHYMEFEGKVKELEDKLYRLENQLAATNNELIVEKEKARTREINQERIKKLSARLSSEQIELSNGAK